MPKFTHRYYVDYLLSEYGGYRDGEEDLVYDLGRVKHSLSEDELGLILDSKRLRCLSQEVLYKVAKAFYIDQEFVIEEL